MPTLSETLSDWADRQRDHLDELSFEPRVDHVGRVHDVGDGVAVVEGLPETRLNEILVFEEGTLGVSVDLRRRQIGCILLDPGDEISAGSEVRGTGDVVTVPVGDELMGRTIDAVGRPLDDGPELEDLERWPVERTAPEVLDRELITRPLETGLLVVDSMIPIGRGQRELIIGDRKTGKTAIAVDTIINQRDNDVRCVYAFVGQKASTIRSVVDAIHEHGDPSQVTFVVGEADDPPAAQWLVPYAATTVAEYYRDHGEDALVVYDDVTKQANVYRELSLLLRRPPGREAYPGDIFYIQSRLMERAANLNEEAGGGSLTALPIAETREGNLSAYLPTNLVSMTDGQIYLDPDIFNEGRKPAVDIGTSVSRVGSKTQTDAIQEFASDLRLEYTQFKEVESFTRFGVEMDEATRRKIDHGRRIRALLSQPQYAPYRYGEELALLAAIDTGLVDEIPVEAAETFRERFRDVLHDRTPDLLDELDQTGEFGDEERDRLLAALRPLVDELGGEADSAESGEAEAEDEEAVADEEEFDEELDADESDEEFE